uniref:Reverse transcriptase domain-containing protein n=1 Tax=Cannabis sativa TaxID=3483 RepID=A0A803PDE7_CANSA
MLTTVVSSITVTIHEDNGNVIPFADHVSRISGKSKGKVVVGSKRAAFTPQSIVIGDSLRSILKRARAGPTIAEVSSAGNYTLEQAGLLFFFMMESKLLVGRGDNLRLRSQVSNRDATHHILSAIDKTLSTEQISFLDAPYSEIEDLTLAILDILNGNADLSPINNTLIALILKKSHASSLKDFRPISLCSTLYKIVAKIIANRLKVVLGSIISPNQGAFLSERIIFDNIFIAQEIVHVINHQKQGKLGWVGLKRDMEKAFDRVEWDFLIALLHHFHFLSKGISIARTVPSISHLLFAEETLLFTTASISSCNALKEALTLYNLASGQTVNYGKSSILFSPNTHPFISTYFFETLGMDSKSFISKYLRVPQSKLGFRAVIKDWKGHIVAGLSILVAGSVTSLMAEDLALRSSLIWCCNIKMPLAVIESDSKLLVERVCGPKHDLSALSDVVDDIRSSLSHFPEVCFRHVARSCNQNAHCLARKALGLDKELSWNAPDQKPIVMGIICDMMLA